MKTHTIEIKSKPILLPGTLNIDIFITVIKGPRRPSGFIRLAVKNNTCTLAFEDVIRGVCTMTLRVRDGEGRGLPMLYPQLAPLVTML